MRKESISGFSEGDMETNNIWRISISTNEAQHITALLDSIMDSKDLISSEIFLLEAQVLSHELPRRIRQKIYDFKLSESAVGLQIANSPVALEHLGPTPTALPQIHVSSFSREEVLHILFSELLGEVIGWSFTRHGDIVHDIVPILEHADELISSGSNQLLDLHTDNAFHPNMNDFLGWICLRNPDSVPTVVANLAEIRLDESVKKILFEPRFLVSPNAGHTGARPSNIRVPILFGHPGSPYIHLNLNVQSTLLDDPEAQESLETLSQALEECAFDVVLAPGDLFFLDNFRAVHGRRPYLPRFDGTDRWLKRLCINSRFRDSRDLRDYPQSRVIHPPREEDPQV